MADLVKTPLTQFGVEKGCFKQTLTLQYRMTKQNLHTTLHRKLIELSNAPAGFSASELTGYSPEQVRRAAEALVASGDMIRHKVSARRIRYFANEDLGKRYVATRAVSSVSAASGAAGSRVKAKWSVDEPGIITSKTKIYIAPPLPNKVYRTNTYAQY